MRAEIQLLHIKETDLLADVGIHGGTVLMIEEADWIELAQDKVRRQDFVSLVMNLSLNGNTKGYLDHLSKYIYIYIYIYIYFFFFPPTDVLVSWNLSVSLKKK